MSVNLFVFSLINQSFDFVEQQTILENFCHKQLFSNRVVNKFALKFFNGLLRLCEFP